MSLGAGQLKKGRLNERKIRLLRFARHIFALVVVPVFETSCYPNRKTKRFFLILRASNWQNAILFFSKREIISATRAACVYWKKVSHFKNAECLEIPEKQSQF